MSQLPIESSEPRSPRPRMVFDQYGVIEMNSKTSFGIPPRNERLHEIAMAGYENLIGAHHGFAAK